MSISNVNDDGAAKIVYSLDERRGQTETHYNKAGDKVLSVYRYDKNGDGKFTDDEITSVTIFNLAPGNSYQVETYIDENMDGKVDVGAFSFIKKDGSDYKPIGTEVYPEKYKKANDMQEFVQKAKLDADY